MPHVPRTFIHITRGRHTTIVSDPIPGLTPGQMSAVNFVLDGEPAVACTLADSGGLVVTAALTSAWTSGAPLGLKRWQMLATLTAGGVLLDPLAEGMAYVEDPAQVGV
jgi:hypothetical protein